VKHGGVHVQKAPHAPKVGENREHGKEAESSHFVLQVVFRSSHASSIRHAPGRAKEDKRDGQSEDIRVFYAKRTMHAGALKETAKSQFRKKQRTHLEVTEVHKHHHNNQIVEELKEGLLWQTRKSFN